MNQQQQTQSPTQPQGIILKVPAGQALFNEHGKMLFCNVNAGVVFSEASRRNIKLVNEGTARAKEITAKIPNYRG